MFTNTPDAIQHIVEVQVKSTVEQRANGWAAYIQPIGTFVYADTVETVMDRIPQAMRSFITTSASGPNGLVDLEEYFDRHNVEYSVTEVSGAIETSIGVPVAV